MPSRQFVNRVEIGKVNRKYVLQLLNYELHQGSCVILSCVPFFNTFIIAVISKQYCIDTRAHYRRPVESESLSLLKCRTQL